MTPTPACAEEKSDSFEPSVTLVFRANARNITCNPFEIETPYGTPHVVSVGDVTALEDIFRAALEEIAEESEFNSHWWPSERAQKALTEADALTCREMDAGRKLKKPKDFS